MNSGDRPLTMSIFLSCVINAMNMATCIKISHNLLTLQIRRMKMQLTKRFLWRKTTNSQTIRKIPLRNHKCHMKSRSLLSKSLQDLVISIFYWPNSHKNASWSRDAWIKWETQCVRTLVFFKSWAKYPLIPKIWATRPPTRSP